MKIVLSTLVLLLLSLSVHKILLPFSLSLSFHQHNKVSSMVKSSKLVMFFAFNLIFMAVLLGYHSKTSKQDSDLISVLSPSESVAQFEGEKAKGKDFEGKKIAEDEIYDGLSDVDSACFHGYDGYDEDNDDDFGGRVDDSDSEDETDDDLNRKIEEFIAKNTRKWEEEQLNEKFLLSRSRSAVLIYR